MGLPKVNYLTVVDVYMIFSVGFIIVAITMHVWVGWQGKDYGREFEILDIELVIAWLASWFGFNVLFMICTVVLRRLKASQLSRWVEKMDFEFLRASEVRVESDMQQEDPWHDGLLKPHMD